MQYIKYSTNYILLHGIIRLGLDPSPCVPPGRGRSSSGAAPLFTGCHRRRRTADRDLPYVIARPLPLPRPRARRRLSPSTPDLHRMEAHGSRPVPCCHGGGQGRPHASTLRCHGGSQIWCRCCRADLSISTSSIRVSAFDPVCS